MLPARHPYVALFLEKGQVEQATQAYAEDLTSDERLTRARQHPKNILALHGYHERVLRTEEAAMIKKQLTLAAAEADVPVGSSCFCRIGKADTCNRTQQRRWNLPKDWICNSFFY